MPRIMLTPQVCLLGSKTRYNSSFMTALKLVLTLIVCALTLSSQTPYATDISPSSVVTEIPANRGSVALWQSLKKLHTRASLLLITAHPDDEDGGLLTYESRGEGARVDMLTLNRGEGGANVMSSDYFDALGLVRTQELLTADRYYGVNQYFTRVIDYGFSKTKAESLSKWTHDRVFYDVVRVVRLTRPLVIASVFVGEPSDGHGNHQTAGALAQEVFKAAGDPNVFPDQIAAGLVPWNPLKNYARVPRNSNLASSVDIPTGQYDPLLGVSYLQLAREGLGFQQSQNHGTLIPPPGPAFSHYYLLASYAPNTQEGENSIFDNIDTSLLGISTLTNSDPPKFLTDGLTHINQSVEEAIFHYSATEPHKSAPALAKGLQQLLDLLTQLDRSTLSGNAKYNIHHELEIKRAQFNNALIEALGISFSATSTEQAVTPGESFTVTPHLTVQSPEKVVTVKISPVDLHAPITRPYFSRPDLEQTYYDILDSRFLNLPLAPDPFPIWADLTYQDVPVRIGCNAPSVVVPALSVSLSQHAGVVPVSAPSFPITASVRSNFKTEVQGFLTLHLPTGWVSQPPKVSFNLPSKGSEKSFTFQVTPSQLTTHSYQISAVAESQGQQFTEGYQAIGYQGLRPYFLYRPASTKISGVDLKVAEGLRVAYIMGSGDDVPAALEQLGIHVTLLSDSGLANTDFAKFDVILLGVRTYAARPSLAVHSPRLLEYVRNGGVLIVQYNTPEFDHNFGPYPYQMTDDPEEVTDETSVVQILDPTNPIFNWPNKITSEDFKGWVEERGSKWLNSWDPRYTPLLETHDEGQPAQRGGLLYAEYGKGIYIYNAYAFYRQLPEGVPGAFRLMANMISLPKTLR